MFLEQQKWSEFINNIGFLVRNLWNQPLEVTYKTDGQPVTNIDHAVEGMILEFLSKHYPNDCVVSEEQPDSSKRLAAERIWLVDPIDGTRSLLKRSPEFSISIALLEHEQLVMAMVYNPMLDTLCWFEKGQKRVMHKGLLPTESSSPVVLTSHQHYKLLSRQLTNMTCRPVGSIAQRMALTAAGLADATVGVYDMHEWDVAAGSLLAKTAGLIVTNRLGEPLSWNQKDLKISGVVVAKAEYYDSLLLGLQQIT